MRNDIRIILLFIIGCSETRTITRVERVRPVTPKIQMLEVSCRLVEPPPESPLLLCDPDDSLKCQYRDIDLARKSDHGIEMDI